MDCSSALGVIHGLFNPSITVYLIQAVADLLQSWSIIVMLKLFKTYFASIENKNNGIDS